MRRRSKSFKGAMQAREMHAARDEYIRARYGEPDGAAAEPNEAPCGAVDAPTEPASSAGPHEALYGAVDAPTEPASSAGPHEAPYGAVDAPTEPASSAGPNEAPYGAVDAPTEPASSAGPHEAPCGAVDAPTEPASSAEPHEAPCGAVDAPTEPASSAGPHEALYGAVDAPTEPASSAGPNEAPYEVADWTPPYLAEPDARAHSYGTLSYNARSRVWTIHGEPCVIELAKRLFPGCDGRGRGVARFVAHTRIIGELNWLMLRYPLEIAERDRARWQKAIAAAREYAARRERARAHPSRVRPPATFTGELMPFQQLGLGFLMDNPRALLADEMGLGKTVQALALLCARGAFPAIVVAPPHLVRNWEREIARFVALPGGTRVHILRGLTPYELPQADVYIVHYLLLRGWKQALPRLDYRAVVFDEVQELRRTGTEKYSAATLLAGDCETVIGLSGTPIYNHGGEIWNVVNVIDYHFLGDWESFTREWCLGYGRDIVARPEELGEHLKREGLMLRRTKRDVLPELPPKRRLVQAIDWDDEVYREYMRPVADTLRSLRGETDAARRAIIEDAISQTERQATGIAKAPYVCACVRALLEAGQSVLLFAHHHAVMDIYRRELRRERPVFITGRESEAEKDASLKAFMNGDTELCCISLRSASGLNLQRASCVVFGELDWSPAVHSQAEDRAHRIGQRDSLLCYYLVSPRGSDQEMQLALGLKVSQFVGLMGDSVPTPEQQLQLAGQARAYISQLVHRLDSELLPAEDGPDAG